MWLYALSVNISMDKRTLLKAAAAAPIIATLHPGASLANASAFQCAANDQANQPPLATDFNDGWVRVIVDTYLDASGNKAYDIDPLSNRYYTAEGEAVPASAFFNPGGKEAVLVLYTDPNDPTLQGVWPKVQKVEFNFGLTGTCLVSIRPAQ